jgi:serine/threonine protein kinase
MNFISFLEDNFACAIKELDISESDGLSSSGRSYQQEMQIMSVIPQHKNIIQLVDSFTLGPKFYLVMEYCDRGDLSDYIRRSVTPAPMMRIEIPEYKIWRLFIQICLALDHIHSE